MSRIHGRQWRDWTIDFTTGGVDVTSAMGLRSLALADCTLEMTVTEGEAKEIWAKYGTEDYQRNFSYHDASRVNGTRRITMRITPEEAKEILDCAKYRDPLETFIYRSRYRLVVVPWRPVPQKTRGA